MELRYKDKVLGGSSGPICTMKQASIVLNHSEWGPSNLQTISVEGVVADEDQQLIIAVPKKVSRTLFNSCRTQCVDQGDGYLIFNCKTIPDDDVHVNVFIFGLGE